MAPAAVVYCGGTPLGTARLSRPGVHCSCWQGYKRPIGHDTASPLRVSGQDDNDACSASVPKQGAEARPIITLVYRMEYSLENMASSRTYCPSPIRQ